VVPACPAHLQLFVRRFERDVKLVSTLEAEVVHFIAEIVGVLRALPQGPQPVVGILDLDTVDELNF
jgi:hypothetical protein